MRSFVALTLVVLAGAADAERVATPMRPPPPNGPRPPPPPQQPPRVPHPPAEVARLAKDLVGTATCKGVVMNGDGSSTPIVGTLESKLDLDGTWLATSFVEQRAQQPGLKLSDFRTYDPIAKQWTRLRLDNAMSYVEETSLGASDGGWTWTGTQNTQNGSFEVRDHEQFEAKQIKLWGESMLSGKWQKLYEITCAR
jgi:hypothetical protein